MWRDWPLVTLVASAALAEAVTREDLVWRPIAVALGLVLALSMLWRRTHPLAMVTLGFGAIVVLDLASVLAVGEPFVLDAGAFVVVLVYSLFLWGTGRQAAIGSMIIVSAWLVSVLTDFTGATEAICGVVVLSLVAALGVVIRYRRIVHTQQLERARFLMNKIRARNRVEIAIWAYETRRVRP